MKIEMGESLFYSWLRHIKECQLVQTNWKPSPNWELQHEAELMQLYQELDEYFEKEQGYKIFKKSSSLKQIIKQAECDVLGVKIQNGTPSYYAVDVAFHEQGLQYGSRIETVLKVLAKWIRTAFCLYGYFGVKEAEIVFAAPKVSKLVVQDLVPFLEYLNDFFAQKGFRFHVQLICNASFRDEVLHKTLEASEGVADTSELFMRGCQMLNMFDNIYRTKDK